MICDDVRAVLPALLDGELPEDAAARIEAHLAACAACARERAALAAVGSLANTWPPNGDENADLWGVIRQEIEAADLRAVLAEMRRLRAEVAALRAEIIPLREKLAAADVEPRRPASRLLFPYVRAEDTPRRIL